MPLLDIQGIAFLKDVHAGWITLVSAIPAVLFSIYVIWDDHRQAKAHHEPGSHH